MTQRKPRHFQDLPAFDISDYLLWVKLCLLFSLNSVLHNLFWFVLVSNFILHLEQRGGTSPILRQNGVLSGCPGDGGRVVLSNGRLLPSSGVSRCTMALPVGASPSLLFLGLRKQRARPRLSNVLFF